MGAVYTHKSDRLPTQSDWLSRPHESDSSSNIPPSEDEESETDTITRRFDWRNFKSSRTALPYSTPATRKRYPHRKSPSMPTIGHLDQCYEPIKNYNAHFQPLIRKEEDENGKEVLERLRTWPLERLKVEGYCLTGTVAYWTKPNQYGRAVAIFQLGPGIRLPDDLKFGIGYNIMVSRRDPIKEAVDAEQATPYTGSISQITATEIRVAFTEPFDESGLWRLDLAATNFIFERMRSAISCLNYDLDVLENEPQDKKIQTVLLGTGLRDIFLHSGHPARWLPEEHQAFHALQDPDDISYPKDSLSHDGREFSPKEFQGVFKDDIRIHSWAERYSRDDPVVIEGDPDFSHLNQSQIKAMATMIGKRISLVQGPPGTGKTKTIIETIKLLRAHFEVPYPILVCTYTNVAVDNLLEGFAKAGLNPLRVGLNARIPESLRKYSLDEQLAKHPLQPLYVETEAELRDIEQKLDDLEARLKETVKKAQKSKDKGLEKRATNMFKAFSLMERQRDRLKGKLWGIHQEMLHDIIQAADVVCTTCITAANPSLNVADFPVVFIDEASMSTEPATLIPIMKGSRHLALIGDHKQLPPVIVSREAQQKGLGVSLFERLTEEGIVPSVMLDIQYRMHPSISYFPSSEFYNNSIQDGTKDKEGNVRSGLEPPFSSTHLLQVGEMGNGGEASSSSSTSASLVASSQRSRPSVIFLDHSGREESSGRSKVNRSEAQIVVSLVEDLLLQNPQLRGRDIGIIAPYVAQIGLLSRILSMNDLQYRQRFNEVLGSQRYHEMGDVEVKTVDGFEGREKEVIIFSTVRNNRQGRIGFLADRRRLNVGLTRAKRGLFVVGSIATLGSHGPGIVGTIAATATTATTSDATTGAESGTKKPRGRGADSWKRYAEWLAREGLVLRLEGENLTRTLFGNRNQRRQEVYKMKKLKS